MKENIDITIMISFSKSICTLWEEKLKLETATTMKILQLRTWKSLSDSDGITEELAKKDVTIVMNPPIRDLSELIGDTKFNYRSMCEFTITFVGLADGKYGVSGIQTVPNPSGGGMKEFVEAETYAIEEIRIQEETDNGN